MRKNRIHMNLIMGLMIGLIFQSFLLPAFGAEYFNLNTISTWSEFDLNWTPVSGATSYDIYKSPANPSKLTTVAANTLWYRDFSIVLGQSYTYWIIAKKGDTQLATSNVSESVAGGEKNPSPPTLSAKAFTSPYVELTWGGSGNALGYELARKNGDNDFSTIAQLHKESSYKDYYVAKGNTYTYRIRAYNDYGLSDYSAEVAISVKSVEAVPDVPAQFTAYDDRVYYAYTDEVKSDKRVVLSWRYDNDDAQGFKVERKSIGGNYSEIANAIPGTNIFTNSTTGAYSYDRSASTKQHYYYDTGISTDCTYYYRIKAYNAHGESAYTKELRVATWVTKVPSPPSNLKAEAVTGKVNLTWNNNSGNENGLHIERRAGSTQSFSEVGSVSAGANSYCDTRFSPNTAYYYRIRAFNDKGTSDYSKEASVTTLSAPSHIIPTADTGTNKSDNVYILLLYASPNAASVAKIKFLTIPPVIKSTTTFLPLRDMANLFDSGIKWDDSAQKVTLTYHNQTVEGWAQKNTALINGCLVAVDTNDPTVTPIIEEEKYIMFPLQLIEKGFQCTIDWQPNDKFIKVFMNK